MGLSDNTVFWIKNNNYTLWLLLSLLYSKLSCMFYSNIKFSFCYRERAKDLEEELERTIRSYENQVFCAL